MNTSIFNQINQRLSLRHPQKDSLEALAKAITATEGALLKKDHDVPALLAVLKEQFPTLSDFEREFPSLCFALATGVGKTRLMGAFITYLHQAHGINNFFVLAPNLTIYEKLITDFTPESAKYVFTGISEFAFAKPLVITGDNYEQQGSRVGSTTLKGFEKDVRINIFNIAKINSEVRGKKAPRIKRMSEYLGESYFNHLANLDDLVMLMDESHRYRASAGVKALNELNPVLGLELTATPFVETAKGAKPFKNVVLDYPLACAMDDGFVKEPAVVTQANFKPEEHDEESLQRIKLMDGIRLHETTKVELNTYATQNGVKRVKPFVLVIARDTTHAAELKQIMEAPDFFNGEYADKIIQVDSSKSGKAEEEMISRLLAVESLDEPTEIVIHVNMLKEGWDVTNLYTIIPLRAANARTLIEQSIGRGLRLPYGKRTGVDEVDRLNIVAHDKFQAIVDAANDPENPLRLKQVILERPEDDPELTSVIVSSNLDGALHVAGTPDAKGETDKRTSDSKYANKASVPYPKNTKSPKFAVGDAPLVRQVYKAVQKVSKNAEHVPNSDALIKNDVQTLILETVKQDSAPMQGELFTQDDRKLKAIIAQLSEWVIDQTIDIPRISLIPKDEVQSGYHAFELDVSTIKLQPSDHEIQSESLQRGGTTLRYGQGHISHEESRPENYIIRELVNRDDVSYDDHADLINQLAHEAVAHLNSYLSQDDAEQVLKHQAGTIANEIYAQMEKQYWEGETEYEAVISEGFMPLKETAFTVVSEDYYRDYRDTVIDKKMIRKLLFTGFEKCLYPAQKFDSDTERQFAILLENQSLKWLKPIKGQVGITYKEGTNRPEYVPDFIAELDDSIIMVETKASKDMNDVAVQTKAHAAREWCHHASGYSGRHGGKCWHYLLIPHDAVKSNMTLRHFIQQYALSDKVGDELFGAWEGEPLTRGDQGEYEQRLEFE